MEDAMILLTFEDDGEAERHIALKDVVTKNIKSLQKRLLEQEKPRLEYLDMTGRRKP